MKKVLLHIDEREKWEMVLKNAQNMMDYYKQNAINYQITIVANSEAVKDYSLTNARFKDIMLELAQHNLLFIACNHALESSGLTSGNIFAFVVVVPSGMVEIVDRQLEGYAYIMP